MNDANVSLAPNGGGLADDGVVSSNAAATSMALSDGDEDDGGTGQV